MVGIQYLPSQLQGFQHTPRCPVNLCIVYGDHGEDLSDKYDKDEENEEEANSAMPDVEEGGTAARIREQRRNQLLQFFQQN
jgi:hypothetical protein